MTPIKTHIKQTKVVSKMIPVTYELFRYSTHCAIKVTRPWQAGVEVRTGKGPYISKLWGQMTGQWVRIP